MTGKAGFALRGSNPDVLMCIANLSNDEVFTPPEFAGRMLDTLTEAWAAGNDGEDIWANPDVTFFDPFTKSGVFLREITARLTDGLAEAIPDLRERVEHILTRQIYGIAITSLTSLLARRSIYCSKGATSKHSIVKSFDNDAGNIWFERLEHTWVQNKCKFCGASEATFDREEGLETHAYGFIHTDDITARIAELFGGHVQFDVIIGNPPYQLDDGGAQNSAVPIYQKFVEMAKKLDPRFLDMVIPARWFVGGRSLDSFREDMLHDDRIRVLHDFPDASSVFPGVEIKGGVCYFLWSRDDRGDCTIYSHRGSRETSSVRPLLEPGMDTFVRDAEQLKIFRKVREAEGDNPQFFTEVMSANDPFGFDVREEGSYKRVRTPFKLKPFSGSVQFYYNGWRRDGLGYVDPKFIKKGHHLVDAWKLFVPRVFGTGTPESDWVKPFIVGPNSCGTETYLSVGPFQDEVAAANALSYTQTRFFHFMVALMKTTQQAMKKVYSFVPLQDFSEEWTDKKLYAKYALTPGEIEYIEATIRPAGIATAVE